MISINISYELLQEDMISSVQEYDTFIENVIFSIGILQKHYNTTKVLGIRSTFVVASYESIRHP